MGINPAVAFTTLLLALMIGAGVVSASWGYALGRQALTGVRQPDSRPASSAAANRATPSGQAAVLRNEQDILNDVQTRISGGAAPDAEPPSN
ncbi:MAG: hypothetical protein HC812_01445 [Leptolyngbya sp. RL_3_1]|nr:hypothetical protein [Leptolyngbya sp. RL_3_1]